MESVSERRHQFKKTVDANEVRLRGIDNAMESRKAQRRELMNAKRQNAFNATFNSVSDAKGRTFQGLSANNSGANIIQQNASTSTLNSNSTINNTNSAVSSSAPAFPCMASRSELRSAHPVDVHRMLCQAQAMDPMNYNEEGSTYRNFMKELNFTYMSLLTGHLKEALEKSQSSRNNSAWSDSNECGRSEFSHSDNESTACSDDDAAQVQRSFQRLSKSVNNMTNSNTFNKTPAGTVRACLSLVCMLCQKNVDWVMQLRGGTNVTQLIDVIFSVFNFQIATEKEVVLAVLEIIGNICADTDHKNLRAHLLEKNVYAIVRGILDILFSNDKPASWTESDALTMASMCVWILRNCVFAADNTQIEEAVAIFVRLLELSKTTNTGLVEECIAGLTEVIEKSNGKYLKAVLICGQDNDIRTHLDVHRKNLIIDAVVNICSGRYIEACIAGAATESEFLQAKQNRAVAFDFVKKLLKTTSNGADRPGDESASMMNSIVNPSANSQFPSSSSNSKSGMSAAVPESLHRQACAVLVNNKLFPAVCNFLRNSAKVENTENKNSILPDIIDCLKILTLLVSEANHLTEVSPILRQGVFLLLRAVGNKYSKNEKFMIELAFCYSKFFIVINDLIDREGKMVHPISWRTLLLICLDEEGMKNCGPIKTQNNSTNYISPSSCTTLVNADFVGIIYDFFSFSTALMKNIIDSSRTNWLSHAKLLNEISACACFLRKQFSLPGNEVPAFANPASTTAIVLKQASDLVSSNKTVMADMKEKVAQNKLSFPASSVLFKMDNTVSLFELNGCAKERQGEFLEKGIVTCGFDIEIVRMFNIYFDDAYDQALSYSPGKLHARYANVEPVRNLGKPLKHYCNLYIECDEEYLSSCGDEEQYFSSGSISLEVDGGILSADNDFGNHSLSMSRRHHLPHMSSSFLANQVSSNCPMVPENNTNLPPGIYNGRSRDSGTTITNNRSENNHRFFEKSGNLMGDNEISRQGGLSRNSEAEAMRRFFCEGNTMQPFGAGVNQPGGFNFS